MGLSIDDDEGLWAAMVQEILDDEDASFDARMKIAQRIFHVRAPAIMLRLLSCLSSIARWVSYNACIVHVLANSCQHFREQNPSSRMSNQQPFKILLSDTQTCGGECCTIARGTLLTRHCLVLVAECNNFVDVVLQMVFSCDNKQSLKLRDDDTENEQGNEDSTHNVRDVGSEPSDTGVSVPDSSSSTDAADTGNGSGDVMKSTEVAQNANNRGQSDSNESLAVGAALASPSRDKTPQ